ncbi:UbiE/COQ5 methyltransferase [Planctomycetes bacterium Pla163]|uniref:Demethylmenaquinone methyltransferase n=1 Tax=Rohdeia mirabilis TaxID=2528008 RepID=A0A518D1K3_9BACT|nr:UbiE/COQ5 methyltransferase [Planctomycetes bacterium Pla163]
MPAAEPVRAMFDTIAPRYDLLNRVLSLGIDRRWRRRTAQVLAEAGCERVLDVACGTGDLTLALEDRGLAATGVDFAGNMLARAHHKGTDRSAGAPAPAFLRGDALRLPFRSGAFDAATIAFGLRNLEDRGAGLIEMARVVRPGGVVAVLEASTPRTQPWRAVYLTYFTRVLPLVGGVISGNRDAYRYLPDTVLAWPRPEALRDEMSRAGLEDCRYELFAHGAAALHTGRVPGAADD